MSSKVPNLTEVSALGTSLLPTQAWPSTDAGLCMMDSCCGSWTKCDVVREGIVNYISEGCRHSRGWRPPELKQIPSVASRIAKKTITYCALPWLVQVNIKSQSHHLSFLGFACRSSLNFDLLSHKAKRTNTLLPREKDYVKTFTNNVF